MLDDAFSARTGALFAMAIVPMHQIHHAITQRIPDDILLHVISEWVAFAIGGAALFAAASAICNLFSQTK
jgi:hypothetical protein